MVHYDKISDVVASRLFTTRLVSKLNFLWPKHYSVK